MLSVTPSSVIVNQDATDTLVHIVQGLVPIVTDELQVLSAADIFAKLGDIKLTSSQLGTELLNLDAALYKLGDMVIQKDSKVSLSDINFTKVYDKASAKVAESLSKIDQISQDLSNLALSKAVEELEADTQFFVSVLGKFAPTVATPQATLVDVLRLSDDFLRLDQDVIKIGSDVFAGTKVDPGEQKYLEIKLQDIQVSSYQLGDLALQKILVDIADQTVGLLEPSP